MKPRDRERFLQTVDTSPFGAAEIAAGGTALAGGPRGPSIRADALAAHAVPPAAAEGPVRGDAGVRAGRAVAVLARPAAPAHALAAVTVAIICKTKGWVS